MKNYFIKFVADWADEMDVHGTCIMSEDELNKFKAYWKKWFDENEGEKVTCGIGSNEELWFYSYEELMDTLEIHEINDIEMAVLQKFKLNSFGCTAVLDEYEDENYDY